MRLVTLAGLLVVLLVAPAQGFVPPPAHLFSPQIHPLTWHQATWRASRAANRRGVQIARRRPWGTYKSVDSETLGCRSNPLRTVWRCSYTLALRKRGGRIAFHERGVAVVRWRWLVLRPRLLVGVRRPGPG